MNGKFQGQDELIMNASKEKIWNILINGQALPAWMPMVQHTTSQIECLDAQRTCDVKMNGKEGTVKEKCVLFDEQKAIGWEMFYDEFGFSKMFANYGFSFELIAVNDHQTKVINRGFYNPKNLMVKVLNRLMMRNKSSKIRQVVLKGIRDLAEK